ncbi:CYTH domain-containing protein [Mammaliicoccus fleurettii]|nr:CYTH domain-containing protein [Mammaliicoccus fleurettii]
MGQELEIEFKNLLTIDEYKLIKQYYFKQSEPFKQTNYYIDTPNHEIISNKMALRIREKNNDYELTLKVPQEVGLLEYNEVIDRLPEQNRPIDIQILPENITEILTKHNIPLSELRLLGDLTTYRLEKKLKSGLLVLDHSIYLGIEDYELEFEVTDFTQGEIAFNDILGTLNISREVPDNKVKRFFDTQSRTT